MQSSVHHRASYVPGVMWPDSQLLPAQNLNDTTQRLALVHTAYNNPQAICIGATLAEVNGLESNAMYLRCGQSRLPGQVLCPQQQALDVKDRNVTGAVLQALYDCGAVNGFFFSSSLGDIINGRVRAWPGLLLPLSVRPRNAAREMARAFVEAHQGLLRESLRGSRI